MAELIAMSYSPWSEKARWALDHHGVTYEESAYLPMLGEPALRLRTRRFSGRVSVPVFLDGDAVIGDSLDIARHAERVGRGAPLFPSAHEAKIRDWNARSEEALTAGRALVIAKTRASDAAKREALPKPLRALGLSALASTGVSYLAKKYAVPAAELEKEREVVRAALIDLRAALGHGRYVVGGAFTYADIAMATVLQLVKAVDDRFIRLGPATRLCWTDDSLAKDLPDLVLWRDALYSEHRTRRGEPERFSSSRA